MFKQILFTLLLTLNSSVYAEKLEVGDCFEIQDAYRDKSWVFIRKVINLDKPKYYGYCVIGVESKCNDLFYAPTPWIDTYFEKTKCRPSEKIEQSPFDDDI